MWAAFCSHMILCLDRDEEKLIAVGDLLRSSGFSVFLCIDPADALRVLTHQGIEIVIAGDVLNGPTGRAILEKARSFMPRIPVIYWTNATEPSETIAELDPDIILSRADGFQELVNVVSILKRA